MDNQAIDSKIQLLRQLEGRLEKCAQSGQRYDCISEVPTQAPLAPAASGARRVVLSTHTQPNASEHTQPNASEKKRFADMSMEDFVRLCETRGYKSVNKNMDLMNLICNCYLLMYSRMEGGTMRFYGGGLLIKADNPLNRYVVLRHCNPNLQKTWSVQVNSSTHFFCKQTNAFQTKQMLAEAAGNIPPSRNPINSEHDRGQGRGEYVNGGRGNYRYQPRYDGGNYQPRYDAGNYQSRYDRHDSGYGGYEAPPDNRRSSGYQRGGNRHQRAG